jgi:hypothetical protein
MRCVYGAVCGAGTSQLLSAASGVFRQQGAALQAQKAHSSYQRSIAGTLAKLRVMHVLEDTATGTTHKTDVARARCLSVRDSR